MEVCDPRRLERLSMTCRRCCLAATSDDNAMERRRRRSVGSGGMEKSLVMFEEGVDIK